MELLRFKPLYKERVWGGQSLATRLGRPLPEGKRIGESWDIVDRNPEQSIVLNGPYRGQTLHQLLETHPIALMGPGFTIGSPFPILVKWLDCAETLSVQVHPSHDIAEKLGSEPKSENWYVLDSKPNAKLYLGLKPGETRESFKAAVAQDQVEALLAEVPSRAGDFFYIKSGSLHAIGAGHLILEIQQNSDSTYRVYDWKRNGLDGKPRKLHLEESFKSMIINDLKYKARRINQEDATLVEAPYFRVRGYALQPKQHPLCFTKDESPRLIHLVEGELFERHSGQRLCLGETALLPYSASAEFVAKVPAKVLITDGF